MSKHAKRAGKASFVKKITGWRGDARLFHVDPPASYDNYLNDPKTTDHVIVSAVYAPFSGPETYIFPANPDGTAINMGELDGSQRGDVSHAEALESAGYEVDE